MTRGGRRRRLLWVATPVRAAAAVALGALLSGLVAIAAPAPPAAADTPEVTDFDDANLFLPFGMATGPDGNVWYADWGLNRIGRVTPTGVFTTFADANISGSRAITSGPDGNLWFTSYYNDRIGRINPTTGTITTFTDPSGQVDGPLAITAGPDNNVWFTNDLNGRIGRITPSGTITTFATGWYSSRGLAAGADGNLWFTQGIANQILRMTPAGVVTAFSSPDISEPWGITAGPDGNLWFTNYGGADPSIGRITPAGSVTTFPTGTDHPYAITAGSDGNLWFAGCDTGSISRITTAGSITRFGGRSGCHYGIASRPDGAIWMTSYEGSAITRFRLLPDGPPSAPRNLTTSYTGTSGEAHLDWDAPSSTGGAPIDNYNVSLDGNVQVTLPESTTEYDLLGLTRGQHYDVDVTATNAEGDGPAASVEVVGADTPLAPENLIATSGNAQVALDWDPPTDDGGSPMTNYRI